MIYGGVGLTALAIPFAAGLSANAAQGFANASLNAAVDPRSPSVRAISSAVQRMASLDVSGPLALASSPAFVGMCGAFGSIMLAKYGIDATRADEDRFVAKKVDEMFCFTTGSEILDSSSGFTDLVRELSESQKRLEEDVNDVLLEEYRSLSRTLLRGGT